MKQPKTCIFCSNQGNISKEHFWPDWLGQYLPKSIGDEHITELYSSEGKSPQRLQKRIERQGNVTSKKIRVVCESCNNNWMSTLESKIKPIFSAVLNGQLPKLKKEQMEELSLWVAIKTIVGEHAENHNALTPSEDRYLIYKNQIIPDYYRIFIGLHSSETIAAYARHSTTVSRTMAGPNPSLPIGIQRNIQSVSFLVGPLIFNVTAARVSDFDIDKAFPLKSLSRLWPSVSEELDLSLLKRIDDAELKNIANIMQKLINSPRVIYGGPLSNPI